MSNDRPLTAQKAANYLDISKSHLYQLTSKGKIPHYKPNGKRLYFYQSDLDDYIKSGKVKTREELETEAADYVLKEAVK